MTIKNFLKSIIQTLAPQNPQGSYRAIYSASSTTLNKYWRFKLEDIMQMIINGGIHNLIGSSPAKLLVQEVILPGNCRPDFMTVPGWYKIDSLSTVKALPPSYKCHLKPKYGGKILKMQSQTSLEKLKKAIERVKLESSINPILEPTRKRVTIPFMERLLDTNSEGLDKATATYLQCILGVRVILVHFKRGNIDEVTIIAMFGTHSRTASDYTQATMNLMNHH